MDEGSNERKAPVRLTAKMTNNKHRRVICLGQAANVAVASVEPQSLPPKPRNRSRSLPRRGVPVTPPDSSFQWKHKEAKLNIAEDVAKGSVAYHTSTDLKGNVAKGTVQRMSHVVQKVDRCLLKCCELKAVHPTTLSCLKGENKESAAEDEGKVLEEACAPPPKQRPTSKPKPGAYARMGMKDSQ